MVRKSNKILVIDDDPEITEIIKSFLSGAGYDVLVENSAVMGVEKSKTYRPDLILLDIMMPVMDGYEVCSSIKKDIMLSSIPVLLLTGKDVNEDGGRGFRCGADLFIKKPFSCERLLQMVRMVLTSVSK
jgi:two-component system phosphate regulon response regulator PhoB